MDASQQEIAALERLVGPQGTSPLFARLADLYLVAGRPQDALRVCDSGLANYPFYTTGHLVRGRTLVALNMTNEARRELEFVRDWLPTNPTVWHYLDSLPVEDDQSLTLSSEAPAEPEASPSMEEPASTVAETAPGDFFGAITQAEAPVAAVDTSDATAPPAETNVFGLPSEAPSGFGGFGGGAATETPASEPESPLEGFSGFSGFGGTVETPADAAAPETPAATYEETVSTALGTGAPGFIAAEAGESFEPYADRLRLELGPTGLITLDQFFDGEGIVPTNAFGPEPSTEPSSAEPSAVEAPTATDSLEMPVSSSSFDMPAAAAEEPASTSESAAVSEGFDFGGFPSSPPAVEPPVTTAETPSGEGLDFSGFPAASEEPTPAPTSSAPEPTEGFAGPSFEGPPPATSDTSIEGLAAKLQGAKKITPVIDFSSKSSSDEDGGTMASSSFVTPTLAEIYAKQGWYEDAIKAYRTLAKTKPAEREKFEERIKELEEEKKKQE